MHTVSEAFLAWKKPSQLANLNMKQNYLKNNYNAIKQLCLYTSTPDASLQCVMLGNARQFLWNEKSNNVLL